MICSLYFDILISETGDRHRNRKFVHARNMRIPVFFDL